MQSGFVAVTQPPVTKKVYSRRRIGRRKSKQENAVSSQNQNESNNTANTSSASSPPTNQPQSPPTKTSPNAQKPTANTHTNASSSSSSSSTTNSGSSVMSPSQNANVKKDTNTNNKSNNNNNINDEHATPASDNVWGRRAAKIKEIKKQSIKTQKPMQKNQPKQPPKPKRPSKYVPAHLRTKSSGNAMSQRRQQRAQRSLVEDPPLPSQMPKKAPKTNAQTSKMNTNNNNNRNPSNPNRYQPPRSVPKPNPNSNNNGQRTTTNSNSNSNSNNNTNPPSSKKSLSSLSQKSRYKPPTAIPKDFKAKELAPLSNNNITKPNIRAPPSNAPMTKTITRPMTSSPTVSSGAQPLSRRRGNRRYVPAHIRNLSADKVAELTKRKSPKKTAQKPQPNTNPNPPLPPTTNTNNNNKITRPSSTQNSAPKTAQNSANASRFGNNNTSAPAVSTPQRRTNSLSSKSRRPLVRDVPDNRSPLRSNNNSKNSNNAPPIRSNNNSNNRPSPSNSRLPQRQSAASTSQPRSQRANTNNNNAQISPAKSTSSSSSMSSSRSGHSQSSARSSRSNKSGRSSKNTISSIAESNVSAKYLELRMNQNLKNDGAFVREKEYLIKKKNSKNVHDVSSAKQAIEQKLKKDQTLSADSSSHEFYNMHSFNQNNFDLDYIEAPTYDETVNVEKGGMKSSTKAWDYTNNNISTNAYNAIQVSPIAMQRTNDTNTVVYAQDGLPANQPIYTHAVPGAVSAAPAALPATPYYYDHSPTPHNLNNLSNPLSNLPNPHISMVAPGMSGQGGGMLSPLNMNNIDQSGILPPTHIPGLSGYTTAVNTGLLPNVPLETDPTKIALNEQLALSSNLSPTVGEFVPLQSRGMNAQAQPSAFGFGNVVNAQNAPIVQNMQNMQNVQNAPHTQTYRVHDNTQFNNNNSNNNAHWNNNNNNNQNNQNSAIGFQPHSDTRYQSNARKYQSNRRTRYNNNNNNNNQNYRERRGYGGGGYNNQNYRNNNYNSNNANNEGRRYNNANNNANNNNAVSANSGPKKQEKGGDIVAFWKYFDAQSGKWSADVFNSFLCDSASDLVFSFLTFSDCVAMTYLSKSMKLRVKSSVPCFSRIVISDWLIKLDRSFCKHLGYSGNTCNVLTSKGLFSFNPFGLKEIRIECSINLDDWLQMVSFRDLAMYLSRAYSLKSFVLTRATRESNGSARQCSRLTDLMDLLSSDYLQSITSFFVYSSPFAIADSVVRALPNTISDLRLFDEQTPWTENFLSLLRSKFANLTRLGFNATCVDIASIISLIDKMVDELVICNDCSGQYCVLKSQELAMLFSNFSFLELDHSLIAEYPEHSAIYSKIRTLSVNMDNNDIVEQSLLLKCTPHSVTELIIRNSQHMISSKTPSFLLKDVVNFVLKKLTLVGFNVQITNDLIKQMFIERMAFPNLKEICVISQSSEFDTSQLIEIANGVQVKYQYKPHEYQL